MPTFDEDEWCDDRDEPAFQPINRKNGRSTEVADPDPRRVTADVPELLAIEAELEGAVYSISDKLWWFQVWNRDAHPGVCVRCEVRARLAVMCIGRTDGGQWAQYTATITVEPDGTNGLTDTTRFSMTPWPVQLGVLCRIHSEEGPLGRLDGGTFARIRNHIDWFESVYPEART